MRCASCDEGPPPPPPVRCHPGQLSVAQSSASEREAALPAGAGVKAATCRHEKKRPLLLRKNRVLKLCVFFCSSQAKELPPKPSSRPPHPAQGQLTTSSQGKYFCCNPNAVIIKQLLSIIVKKRSYIVKLYNQLKELMCIREKQILSLF